MNDKTTTQSTNENKKEYDILEEQFMQNSCKVEDIPIPKKKVECFEFEIRKIMESGCNRQIAEYSLLKCEENNIKDLKNLKAKYIEVKNKIRKSLDGDVEVYLENLKNDRPNDINEEVKFYPEYEEEADEIIEEKFDIIENEPKLLTEKDSIKKYIMTRYKYFSDGAYKDEKFFDYKKAYTDKRDAILEAALRVVKKVVNDEIKYDTFYKEYKSMQ